MPTLRCAPALGLAFVLAAWPLFAAPTATKKAEKVAPLAPPKIRLTINVSSELWQLSLENLDDVPLDVVADSRLLRLEIEPSTDTTTAKKPPKVSTKSVVCELPGSMRSTGRTLIMPPGGKIVESFDPRLLCLGASKELAPGRVVHARLGWAAGKGTLSAPYVVTADARASAKEIGALPLVLAAPDVSSAPSSSATAASTVVKPAPLTLVGSTAAGSSHIDEPGLSISLSIKNESAKTIAVYARPQLLAARVLGPRGEFTICAGPPMTGAPLRDFVMHLRPGGVWSANTLVASICPKGTFARPGLYVVRPYLKAQSIPWLTDAFVGDIAAANTQLVRIEVGSLPFHDYPLRLVPVTTTGSASASVKPPVKS